MSRHSATRTLAAIAAATLMTASLSAAPCKDARGKFTRCPPARPAVNKDARGRCHVAAGPKKGQLTKC